MIVQQWFGKLFALLLSRSVFAFTLCVCAGVNLNATPGWADLQEYVNKPEPAFEWQLKNKIEQSGARIDDLQFVSQVWAKNGGTSCKFIAPRTPRRARRCFCG